jgi:RNA polymerase sigma factor (sigma-70 family)
MDNTLSDRALIDGCLAGDNPAREQFVRRFSRLVYSTILGAVKAKGAYVSEQDVEDLHNTVFVSFFDRRCRKLRQYEGRNGCSLASWVRMVAVRAVLDFLRRRSDPLSRPEKLTSLELLPDADGDHRASPWACMMAKEQRVLIEKGLQMLTARDQLMIRLHCLEERPLAQVAAILEVSEANMHSVKHRAVQRLKEAVTGLMKKKVPGARKNRTLRP